VIAKRPIHIDMKALEDAFEMRDSPFIYYLDTESGKCVVIPNTSYDGDIPDEMEAEIELVESAPLGRFLPLQAGRDLRPFIDDAREFARTVDDVKLRNRLIGALGGRRGAFRQFLDVLHEEAGEVERWYHFGISGSGRRSPSISNPRG
jgi:Uncharacterised protein family (UPF0158)